MALGTEDGPLLIAAAMTMCASETRGGNVVSSARRPVTQQTNIKSCAASLCPSERERTLPCPSPSPAAHVASTRVSSEVFTAATLTSSRQQQPPSCSSVDSRLLQTHLQFLCDALALGHQLWDDLRLLSQVLQLLQEGWDTSQLSCIAQIWANSSLGPDML